ncbi:FIVAR domain-containing protein [[Mycoplasma] imitans]|uniref:FIVAR domain-containing protein n=1 Tax=[Mycoplasma] imitans TaxID=29560 RepID=UPI0004865C8E|nr:FIVAR domain-containing protein [[Mycoplasma] imitans]
MKRKNILKFISLLGVGSFVSLAVASCGQVATPNPEKPKPEDPSKPSNPGNDEAKQLADAKAELNTLISSQRYKVGLYGDYAKIQKNLSDAYAAATAIKDNANATPDQLKTAKSTLQTAITSAESEKTAFNTNNPKLVEAYTALKTTLEGESKILSTLNTDTYSGIKARVGNLYDLGKAITNKTLQPTTGDMPTTDQVTQANSNINEAITQEKLDMWKQNADMYSKFDKQVLDKSSVILSGSGSQDQEQSTNNKQAPNYSFVGYSVDVRASNEDKAPAWNYTKRTVFTIDEDLVDNQNGTDDTKPLTDLSWNYSLNDRAKYKLKFTYYGPTTAYLYFPYKLVRSDQSTKVALDYSLNGAEAKAVNFMTSSAEVEATNPSANEDATNPAPTVSEINVAKLVLTNLKFGENEIDFSVPSEKVAPMFGNFYITSSTNTTNSINDDIFGNIVNNDNNQVTVDLLKGYNLAADHSTFFAQYANATIDGQDEKDRYLVGFIGGSDSRRFTAEGTSTYPSSTGNARSVTFYVNAPQDDNYYVSGLYNTRANRTIKLWTKDEAKNFVQIVNLNSSGQIKTFDTKTQTGVTNKTIKLSAGLNKIIIRSTADNSAPNIGNLTFTLMPAENVSTE